MAMDASWPREVSLRSVLADIYAQDLPKAEKRRLASRAVTWTLRPAGHSSECRTKDAVISELQHILSVIAEAGGVPRMNVTEAKAWLRARGHAGLASRVGKLSKVRNSCAHPDTCLVDDIMRVLPAALTSQDVRGQGLGCLQVSLADMDASTETAEDDDGTCQGSGTSSGLECMYETLQRPHHDGLDSVAGVVAVQTDVTLSNTVVLPIDAGIAAARQFLQRYAGASEVSMGDSWTALQFAQQVVFRLRHELTTGLSTRDEPSGTGPEAGERHVGDLPDAHDDLDDEAALFVKLRCGADACSGSVLTLLRSIALTHEEHRGPPPSSEQLAAVEFDAPDGLAAALFWAWAALVSGARIRSDGCNVQPWPSNPGACGSSVDISDETGVSDDGSKYAGMCMADILAAEGCSPSTIAWCLERRGQMNTR